jgi:hypothetical protein
LLLFWVVREDAIVPALLTVGVGFFRDLLPGVHFLSHALLGDAPDFFLDGI